MPCVTVRENTERPVTVTLGTNVLVGQDMGRLRRTVDQVLAGHAKPGADSALVGRPRKRTYRGVITQTC